MQTVNLAMLTDDVRIMFMIEKEKAATSERWTESEAYGIWSVFTGR